MTREETIKLLSVLKCAYPSFYRDITKQEAERSIQLWMLMFDEPYELVGAAVKSFIAGDTKGFPPAIGQIKEQIRLLTRKEEMTEIEAWSYVSKALKNSTYGSEDEFAKLPQEVQAVVHDPGQLRQWAMSQSDEVETVIASNFMRSFRAKQKSSRQYAALPEDVKRLMIQAGYGNDPQKAGLARLFGGDKDDELSGSSGDRMDRENRIPELDAGER